jgi:hypothetical protein
MMRFQVLLALGVITVGFASANGPVWAASPGQDGSPLLAAVSAAPDEEGWILISARFTTVDGHPVDGREVRFFLDTGFLGRGRLSLGSNSTDAAGEAGVRYIPNWDGTHRLTAIISPSDGKPGADSTITFEVSGARGPYHPEPPALQPLGRWTLVVAGLMVVVVWATMAVLLLRTVGGIWVAGRKADQAERYAPPPSVTTWSRRQIKPEMVDGFVTGRSAR